MNANFTRCACTHLTAFTLSQSDFNPRINIISKTQLKNVTLSNLSKYPTAFITIGIILFVFWIIIICLPHSNDKPIISQMRPWSQLQYSKWIDTYDCKFDQILVKSNIEGYGVCYGLLHLSWLDIKNNHYVLAVFLRDHSTNWSGPQRMFCFLASMVTLACINAAYYGKMNIEYPSIDMSIVVNYTYASLFGSLVPMILSLLFSTHRPSVAVRSHFGLYETIKQKWQERKYEKGNKKGMKLDKKQIEFDILGLMAQRDYQLNKGHKKLKAYSLKKVLNKDELLGTGIDRQLSYTCIHMLQMFTLHILISCVCLV